MSVLWSCLWIFATLIAGLGAFALSRRWGVEVLLCVFVALFVASNILANKLIVFFGFVVPGGVVLFSVTFFLTDLLSEFHGEKAARKAVWLGFLAQLLIIPAVWATIRWPHPDFWQGQEAFASTLGNTWRIALASMIAYLVSQHHDVWAYQFWKRKTGGKHLWIRNNLSTIASQSLDSVIFVTIAFSGLVPIWPIIAGQLVAKIAIALFDTPFMYLAKAIWPNSSSSSMVPQ